MKGPRFVEKVVFDDAVLVARSGGIQAHLQVLIVDLDVMKRELRVGEDADLAAGDVRVANFHIPEFHVVIERDEQRLLGMQVTIVAGESRIRKTMAAFVERLLQILADRLPGDRPVFARLIVAQVNVVAGPVRAGCR